MERHSVDGKTSTKIRVKYCGKNYIFTNLNLWSRNAPRIGGDAYNCVQIGSGILPIEIEAVAVKISNIFTHVVTVSKHFCGGYFLSLQSIIIQVLEMFEPWRTT